MLCRGHSHLSAMRTRYDSNGGQLQLCAESKKLLNLTEPSQWRLDALIAVQPLVLIPLLKYWSVTVVLTKYRRLGVGE